jgi:beta-glucosidase/6-phospho-beta-glucosidase/beta-galactosidase
LKSAHVLDRRIPPFVAGGFEGSSQRRPDGVRLDLVRATRHDAFAHNDYAQLAALGIRVARDCARWHLIEQTPGRYDWSSVLGVAKAAAQAGVRVIWDLCHYGWPDHIDVWSDDFVAGLAAFASAFADFLRREFGGGQIYCPINEISYLAWAGGDVGRMNPCTRHRGAELKRVLAKASIAATRATRAKDADAVFICAEPLINVVSRKNPLSHFAPRQNSRAENYRQAQFEALDMVLGRRNPELGGSADLVDLIGLNFYSDNQWYLGGATIPMGHFAYRPLADMLAEVHRRYNKPVFLSETGAEGRARTYWLHYVAGEVCHALRQGVPVRGLCLFPVVDYPGWENGRKCEVGLLGDADDSGRRSVYGPLAQEMQRAQAELAAAWNCAPPRDADEFSTITAPASATGSPRT